MTSRRLQLPFQSAADFLFRFCRQCSDTAPDSSRHLRKTTPVRNDALPWVPLSRIIRVLTQREREGGRVADLGRLAHTPAPALPEVQVRRKVFLKSVGLQNGGFAASRGVRRHRRPKKRFRKLVNFAHCARNKGLLYYPHLPIGWQ